MLVCGNRISNEFGTETCGKEMKCVKTGMNVWIRDNYTYAADLYECPRCKMVVANVNSNGNHVSDEANKIIKGDAHTVFFDETHIE